MIRHVMLACAVLLAASVAACADEKAGPLRIDAARLPLADGETVPTGIGQLKHLGSLRLTSSHQEFGGLSGLIVSADGSSFLAITDSSHWLTGKLQYRDGRLAGATGGNIAPLLDLDGKPLSGKDGDAEGLTGSLDGDVCVSFERDHRIWKYPFASQGLSARPSRLQTPPELAKAPENGGMEAITRLPGGRILAITESFHDSDGNIRGWLLGEARGSASRPVILMRRSPFDLTDLAVTPSGDILTLERRYSALGGVGFSMRRIPQGGLSSTAPLDGEVIADAGMNFNIDNMEGLSIRQASDGKTIVYLLSDDNFNSRLQKTIIMMFELQDRRPR